MSSVQISTLQDPSQISEISIFDNLPFTTLLTNNLYELLLVNVNLPSYNLTNDQISWINEFIKNSPASFDKITSDIKSITATGEIELNHLPQIVKLCADVYYSGAINYNLVNSDNIIAFIKFTINVILNSQLIIIHGVDNEVVQALVDTSLTLLSMNISTIKTEIMEIKSSSCFIRFFQFFKIK
jgi:hypothetical protein